MNDKFIKISEKRKKRIEEIYSIDEDWTNFSPICPDHPGVRRLHVGMDEAEKKGYSQADLVWKCPVDDKIYAGEGSVAEQTDGFSSFNNTTSVEPTNETPVQKEASDAANKLASLLWDK